MDDTKLRAWWAHRQGLDGRLAGKSAAEVLAETGWARSVGGVNPYLTLFARAGIGREETDKAVRNLEIYELPTARGCTYVLPACDYALGLAVGQQFGGSEMKLALQLGASEAEIEKICDVILKALGKAPLTTDELREAAGGAVRNFGPEGAKKGTTTTLPVALGRLQSAGEIRRVPLNGRLDQQRYRYTLWRPNPLAGCQLSREEAFVELARRFFHWAGPATLAEFQRFSGLGVKAAKAALESLHLEPAINGADRLLLPHEREQFEKFKLPPKPQYSLVSQLDGISLLRSDLRSLLATEDLERPVPVERKTSRTGELGDLPSHAIFDRGRLVGFWLYDIEAESIVWMAFPASNATLKAAIARTEEYIRAQLGDARAGGPDSPKSRAPRLRALRKAAQASA
jgi:Winged helix DNA-binding domain